MKEMLFNVLNVMKRFYAIDLNVVSHKDALKLVYSIVKFERQMKYAAQ